MLKLIFAVVGLYLVLQFALGVDVNKHLEPALEPLMELVGDQVDEGLPELSKQFFDSLSSQDLSDLIESQDFDLSEISSMIEDQDLNLDKLKELIEEQEFDTEAAQEKLKELQKLVEEKLEENQ